MRCNVLVSLMLGCITLAGWAAAPPSPWPDPSERAAFQRQELARYAPWAEASRQPATARSALQDRYDVIDYRLSLDLRDVDGEWIYGELTATISVTEGPLDTLLFDLHDTMQVDSLFVDDEAAAYGQSGADLRIFPFPPLGTGATAEIRIHYQGHPYEPAGAFGWNSHEGTPIIWSMSEPMSAPEWWPCKDDLSDKADSIDVLLRAPDWMIPTSNGLLVEKTVHGDGSSTYHWKHRYPIATFLVSVTATNYERLEDWYVPARGDSMLIEHFVYPELVVEAEEDFSITPEAIGAFADLFGPYPFIQEKYGHSLFPWGGAMEHQTNTSYGAMLVRGDHTYDWILVHEAGHMWWGDMTTPADWRDVWLKEGFASYCEALWYEHLFGFEGLHDYMVYYQPVSDPSGPIYDPDYLFDSNTVYNKGAWVCHMLRYVLGDELFFAALGEYRARTEYRSTTTAEFQAIVEEVAGEDLDWFFQPWVYGVNRPHYEVSFLPFDDDGTPAVAIHLDQTQTEWDFFPMPVEVEVALMNGGSVRERFWNDPDHLDVEIQLPATATDVTVDPDDWILREIATTAYTMHITTTDLPEGTEGQLFEATLHGRGGVPPYSWAAVGALPPGIDLDPDTGVLSGTAPSAGEYAFTVRLSDQAGGEDDQLYRWSVQPDPAGVEERGEPAALLALGARPSPARGWISFTVGAQAGEPVFLALYDLSGRRVRTLFSGTAPSEPVRWDGLDDQGRRVASGIYLACLVGRSERTTRRVVWLR